MKKTAAFIFFLSVLTGFEASGQNSQLLYYMNLPQNHTMNPALRPTNSLYIGLPALTGINVSVNNNFINPSDIFMRAASSDSLITFLHPDFDLDRFLSGLNKKNSISPQASIQLLGLGFKAGSNNYLFFDVTDRIEGNVVIPEDLIALMLKGNEGFAGSKIDLGSLRADMKYFREFGLGFSRSIDRLRFGVRGKLLFGIASVGTVNKGLSIGIDESYNHSFSADLGFNISAPVNVYTDEKNNIDSIVFDDARFDTGRGVRNFLMGTQNFGLGLDLGAVYDLNDMIQVSASVTDLGYIRWKKDITNLRAEDHFLFSGLSMVDVLKGEKTFSEVGDEMVDSLKNSLVVSRTATPFNTWLPVGITLGGSYKLTRDVSLGLLSYSRVVGKQFREALTLSANVNVGSSFSASLGYTLENQRADNLGAGLAFRLGVFQFYMIADRIPLSWTRFTGDNSFVLPSNFNTVNLRLGFNLVFGNKMSSKTDKPMIDVH
jgi:hypothetical protein